MSTTKPALQKVEQPFANRLLDWYSVHARSMPWRVPPHDHAQGVRPDPYHVWLSEIMLQQTQVVTVKDYFQKFITLWPTLADLAAADEEDILKAWAGLGYYSRARNLKKCADILVSEYDGNFPSDFDGLKKLPGIGDYTAAAIASIAFDQPVPVIDGNIERVITRHKQISTPIPAAKPEIKEILNSNLSQQKPGEFAQAMMDLGATICTPKRPACALCPVKEDCLAFKAGDQELYPVKLPKKEKPTRRGAAFVILNPKYGVYLTKRGNTGLLAGMTQVPTTDWNSNQDGATGSDAAPIKGDWLKAGFAKHTFTHFHLELEVWKLETETSNLPENGWWCAQENLTNEALPKVMQKVLAAAIG